MLAINDVSFFFGSRPLYENVSMHIKPKDRIGLIGANGTGKSTLLRLICGEYQADKGSISKSKDCTIGYLNQDLMSYLSDDSILKVAMQAFERENWLLDKINEILSKMETDYTDELVEDLAKKQEEFESLDGYTLQSKAEEILEGLGFKSADLERPLREFSGGWRMRVMLAKILLGRPSLLLLDEPTNHMDLPSIEWIERYFAAYEGAIIIVSHDRQFLNNACTSIAELSLRTINVYSGNYDFYLEEKDLRAEIHNNAVKNQQKKIKETEQFINRFKAKATKARQVQSRVKGLEKLDVLEEIRDDNTAIDFKFNFKKPSGKVVLELKDMEKSYGDHRVFKKSDAVILRGDKIALIGANGKGKTTVLKIVNGLEPIEGKLEMGFNVDMSLFAQHQLEALEPANEILEELKMMGSEKTELELRAILGAFLFTNDDVFKKIKILSGGEKSRVALAKTLISEANFLLLDEPTNHLDIVSVNMLIQALQQYQGTYVIVSHDRHFISQTANKIWYIEDEVLKEFPGTYDEFNYWMAKKESEKPSAPQKTAKVKEQKPTKPRDNSADKVIQKDLSSKTKSLQKVESEIQDLEGKKKELEDQMAKPDVYSNFDLLGEKTTELNKVEADLESRNNIWEELALEIDELQSQLDA